MVIAFTSVWIELGALSSQARAGRVAGVARLSHSVGPHDWPVHDRSFAADYRTNNRRFTSGQTIMKLSRTVIYALQAACQLGSSGQDVPVPSKKIAEAGQMPDRFLLQILRNLVAHGLLRSTRGVIGGYTLARTTDEISLLDIIEAVEGPVAFEVGEVSTDSDCLQNALEAVTVNIRRDLGEVKLSHLLRQGIAGHGLRIAE